MTSTVARFTRLIWVCSGLGCALAVAAAPPSITETVKSRARQRVDYGYNAGISIGLINAEGRDYFSYGRLNFEDPAPVNERTIFEIGSVTKVFTSLLLADAVARGEVGFDQSVQSLLPIDFPIPSGTPEISLVHLATHRSGLPNNPSNLCLDEPYRVFECLGEMALRQFLSGYALPRQPGETWEYSNLGMGLLGFTLAHRFNQTYEQLLRERLLEPMGMKDTQLEIPAALSARVATGHNGVLERPPFRMASLGGRAKSAPPSPICSLSLPTNWAFKPTRSRRPWRKPAAHEGLRLNPGSNRDSAGGWSIYQVDA